MHVNIREELCYIELLHIFEWKNRNSEIVRRRGWQGLKADFSKPQVDTLVIESMCFFSTQAVFGQGWPNIKYSPLGEKGRHKQDLATICLGARSALPLRGEPSVPLCAIPFRLPSLHPRPSPRKFLSGNPEKGSEKAKDPTSSPLPALASPFPLSPQPQLASVQMWDPISSLSPPPPPPPCILEFYQLILEFEH